MLNLTAATTSARSAVAEYMLECAQESERFDVIACAFVEIHERELEAERAERYAEIKAKYDAARADRNVYEWDVLTSEEYWFMRDYEDEQWRNSDAYAKTLAWLDDPANWDDPEFSDIYKDVYGYRPRFCCGRGYWSY